MSKRFTCSTTARARRTITRRRFLTAAAAASAATAAPRFNILEARTLPPNERLNIAAIGAGGQARFNIMRCGSDQILPVYGAGADQNIVALCDVDDERAAQMYEQFPDLPKFKDFRVMLDQMDDEIDAVIVTTPDHTHAVAALACMERGKHVYVEKPMAHSLREARILTEAARYHGVMTQMGNQGHAGEGTRELCEMIWANWIGPVHTVHCWTNRPTWPQGVEAPEAEHPPEHLDWNLWLGPARQRPYSSAYAPHRWRGFWDFGTGALGDMGCHIMDPAYWALQLGYPESVEVVKQQGATDVSAPTSSVIKYTFGERPGMPPVTLYWYSGGESPPRPEGVDEDEVLGENSRLSGEREGVNGSLFIGENGVITCGTYGMNPRLLPATLMEDREKPTPVIPRSTGPHEEWILACKGGPKPMSNFDYSGPFTETVLLGVLAERLDEQIEWDAAGLRAPNLPEADPYVRGYARTGWAIP